MATDVIVVGGGLSGLSAARRLSQQGLKVVVLEATDRVGGRTHTYDSSSGEPPFGWADVGASFVGPSQHHVLRLCEELGVKDYLCSDKFKGIQFSKGRRTNLNNVVPSLWWSNPLAAWDLRIMLNRLEKMVWEIPADNPWEAPHAEEWDQMTLKEFYDKTCWTKQCREFLVAMSNMDNTAHQHEMSLLFYLWYMRQGNGPLKLWSVSGGAQERKLEGGSEQLCSKMAHQLGESVKLSQPVVVVRHTSSEVSVKTLDGTEYTASYLILATPPVTQLKIHFDPPLPMLRRCLIQRSPMGLVMKCVLFYEEPFWEHRGYNGYVACADGVEVAGLLTEDYKPGVKLAGLICFVFLDKMVKVSQMSDEDKKVTICKSVAKIFNSDQALEPVHFVYKIWSNEPYVCGAYTVYYPPGVLTMFGPAIRAPIGQRVFLAGTETATHWTGYMCGAIDAGERAAREVLHAGGRLRNSEVFYQYPAEGQPLSWCQQFTPSIEDSLKVLGSTLALGAALLLYRCNDLQSLWQSTQRVLGIN